MVSAGAFTLLCYAFWFSSKGGCSPYFSVLPTRCLVDVSRLFGLTLRPCAPLSLPLGCFYRRELALAQEAVRGPPSLSPCLVLRLMTFAR